MDDLLPPSVAVALVTAPAGAPSGWTGRLIGAALFEVEQCAPRAFLYRFQVRTVPPQECAHDLVDWLAETLPRDRLVVGWELAATAVPALLGMPPLGASDQGRAGCQSEPKLVDLADTMPGAASLAEPCRAVGIRVAEMSESELRASWGAGREVELTGLLATNVVALWRLWAHRRGAGPAAQQLGAEALAQWRVGDDSIRSWPAEEEEAAQPPEDAAIQLVLDALIDRSKAVKRYVIPATALVRPCERIEPEAAGTGLGYTTLADRYAALIEPLPLAGAQMLRVGTGGEIALTARLRAAAPWLEPAIATIDRQLRIQNWAGRPWIAWRPLCLVGPPGCGKSYLARAIGQLTGSGHATLDLGGVSDSRTLEGTARGWTSAQPCWPAVVMAQTRSANPVLTLEEVEKAGGSRQGGTPHATLLTMLERETARHYWDKCLLAEVDLSHVCWILTCNDIELLPAPLRSRLDIVTVTGPELHHFDPLVAAIIIDLATLWAVPVAMMPDLPGKALRTLRNAFVAERSVRRLRRHIERIIAAMIPLERRATH